MCCRSEHSQRHSKYWRVSNLAMFWDKNIAVVLVFTNNKDFPLSIYLSEYLFAALMPLMVLTT